MSENGFSKKQLEQLQSLMHPIVERLDNIETRFDNLEQKVNEIKSLPTIQKELKLQKKK